jgi:hypothetical protein
VTSFNAYRRGLTTYEVTYKTDRMPVLKSMRIMAEDTYQASMILRDAFTDVTIVRIAPV